MKKNLIPLVAMMLFAIASCTSNTKVAEKSDALYRILVGEKYGFIDERGIIVVEPQFDNAYTEFTEGICFAQIGDRRGLIDRSGSFTMEFAERARVACSLFGPSFFSYVDVQLLFRHFDHCREREIL